MKIILTGAQGTGKSTLNRELTKILQSEIKSVKSIDSMSKKFFKKEHLKNIESKEFLDAQLKIFAYASNEYLNTDSYISSRGFSDSYAYCKHVLDKNLHTEAMSNIISLAKQYHSILECKIFYIPIEFSLESKDLRSTNAAFQREIDSSIKEFLDSTSTKYITIHGTVQQRLDIILENIKL